MSDHSPRDEEAWSWVIQMDRPTWGTPEENDLQLWLASDPRNHGALLEAEAMWEALGLSREKTVSTKHEPLPKRKWSFMAASIVLLVAAVVGGIGIWTGPREYGTEIGEIRRVPLADGSVAAINTASLIDVEVEVDRRRIRLIEGEAFFQVSKDKERPFIVEAGPIRVQAVGTAFAVRRLDKGAEVLVKEGVVRAWTQGAEGAALRLAAGERAIVSDNAAIDKDSASLVSVDQKLAWRHGNVEFVNETVSSAARELNRYNQRKLLILDPSIGNEKFVGIFRTDDPEGFAMAIKESLSARVRVTEEDRILIDRGNRD